MLRATLVTFRTPKELRSRIDAAESCLRAVDVDELTGVLQERYHDLSAEGDTLRVAAKRLVFKIWGRQKSGTGIEKDVARFDRKVRSFVMNTVDLSSGFGAYMLEVSAKQQFAQGMSNRARGTRPAHKSPKKTDEGASLKADPKGSSVSPKAQAVTPKAEAVPLAS